MTATSWPLVRHCSCKFSCVAPRKESSLRRLHYVQEANAKGIHAAMSGGASRNSRAPFAQRPDQEILSESEVL